MRKIILIGLLGLVLVGCGGGSDGGAGSEAGTNEFPKVAGTYSFNTSEFKAECSDGSTDTSPKTSLNVVVVQNNNELTVTAASPNNATPGLTIIEETDFKGLIKSDGSISLSSRSTATADGITGNITVSESVVGMILDGKIFGDYEVSVFYQDLSVSCEFKATFTGVKL